MRFGDLFHCHRPFEQERDERDHHEHHPHDREDVGIAHHQRLLGQDLVAEDPEIERTFQLFTGIIADANAQGQFEPRETYFCGGREEFRTEDTLYTIRAWRGVMTYLLRQHSFLRE